MLFQLGGEILLCIHRDVIPDKSKQFLHILFLSNLLLNGAVIRKWDAFRFQFRNHLKSDILDLRHQEL